MLAQSHARKPAPPLAARGMWLRLHGGADAFGSALGDAVVGAIQRGDAEKVTEKFEASKQRLRSHVDERYGELSSDGESLQAGRIPGERISASAGYLSLAQEARAQAGPIMTDAGSVSLYGGGGVGRYLAFNVGGVPFSNSEGYQEDTSTNGASSADSQSPEYSDKTGVVKGSPARKAQLEAGAGSLRGTVTPSSGSSDGWDAMSPTLAKAWAALGGGANGRSLSLWDTPVPGLSDLHGYVGQKIDDNFGNNWLGKGLNLVNDFAIPATYGDLAMTGLGMVLPEGRALSGELKLGRGAEELAMAERGGARNAVDYAKYSDELRALQRQDYLSELAANGIKHTPENIVDIRRIPDGRLAFLETGNADAGLEHIMRHADDFAKKGVHADQIPDLVMTAVERGNIVGYQGRGTGRPIYEVMYNDVRQRVAVTMGNNGFIVGANPVKIK